MMEKKEIKIRALNVAIEAIDHWLGQPNYARGAIDENVIKEVKVIRNGLIKKERKLRTGKSRLDELLPDLHGISLDEAVSKPQSEFKYKKDDEKE